MELFKRSASTSEKQLAEKDAIIDSLLNQKVQNEIGNTAFTSKVSHSDIQREKTSTVALDIRHLKVEVAD